MSLIDDNRMTQGAVQGWQVPIKGALAGSTRTGVPADVLLAERVVLVGATLSTGTYYFSIPVVGAATVEVTLRASAGTGTLPTPTIYKTLNDGQTEKMNAAGASAAVAFTVLVAGTQQTATITTLKGERYVMLKIIVAGASSVTFDQAESSAL